MLIQPVYSVEIPYPQHATFCVRSHRDVQQMAAAASQLTLSLWQAASIQPWRRWPPRLNQYRSAPARAARRQRVSRLQGTRMAHVCHRGSGSPLVAMRESAGEPPCFHRGARVMCGAPKGIRNLTSGSQPEPARLVEHRIVAGQTACVVPVRSSQSRPASRRFSPPSTHKAREWHATQANKPTRNPGRFTSGPCHDREGRPPGRLE
jgi:hypothetical protein